MGRPRTFDEQTVIEAVRDRFWASGYSATALSDLVEATGLGKASLYNAFGDKHALYVQAFEQYCAAITTTIESELAGPDDGAAARLRHLVRRLADREPGTPPPTACFLAKATAELGADPEVSAIARRAFTRLEALLQAGVEAAQRAGAIAAPRDARGVARHVLVAIRGFDALAAAGVDRSVLTAAAEDLIATVLPEPLPEASPASGSRARGDCSVANCDAEPATLPRRVDDLGRYDT